MLFSIKGFVVVGVREHFSFIFLRNTSILCFCLARTSSIAGSMVCHQTLDRVGRQQPRKGGLSTCKLSPSGQREEVGQLEWGELLDTFNFS